MITLYANGGLGNQLFNYAAARTLADRTQTELVIDADSYWNQWGPDALRPHVLHRFPARATYRNLGRNTIRKPIVSRIARRLREDVFTTVVDRPSTEIGYFSEFQRLGGRTILKGHYISPRFFAGNEERIRRDLTLVGDVLQADETAIAVLAEIRSRGTSVAVHVRRGDLLTPELSWLVLPNMDVYYGRALERMIELLPKPVFWVFSDDLAWCRTTFSAFPGEIRIVDMLADRHVNPMKEFFLMSQCHSFVIANSAFSWWGAWLSSNKNKRVIAPYKWDCSDVVSTSDLIPDEWEKLSW